jgi:RNA polymerase sigma factor (sigma-70 family)
MEGRDMSTGLGRALNHIRLAWAPPEDVLSDAELLGRFVAERDEEAFAALVRRHGPMVLGVSRRLLPGAHDCEDCFQAVFMVLACKAAAVVKRASVACWLHGVALRCALGARAAAARRRAKEGPMDGVPEPTVAPPEPRDWVAVLDDELGKLAEKYRSVLLLCDLQGRTRKEAARLLGVPPGTVDSRLAAARKSLAGRLTRRGVTLPAGAMLTAAVPATLACSTVRAAALAAAGQAAAASTAALLMREVLTVMFVKKLCKAAAVAVLAVAALGGGLAYRGVGPGAAHAAPPEARGDKPLSELEALRRENELLRASLRLALDKVETLEATVRDLRKAAEDAEARARAQLDRSKAQLDSLLRSRLDAERAAKEASLLEMKRLSDLAEAQRAERALAAETEATLLEKARAQKLAEQRARAVAEALAAKLTARRAEEQAAADKAAIDKALDTLRSAKDEKARQEAINVLEAALKKLREQKAPPAQPQTP